MVACFCLGKGERVVCFCLLAASGRSMGIFLRRTRQRVWQQWSQATASPSWLGVCPTPLASQVCACVRVT